MKTREIAVRRSMKSWFMVILLAFAHVLLLLPHDAHAAVSTAIAGDGTLGTTVNGQPLTTCTASCGISGGTLKGANQFHSFDVFSVGAGDVATFNVPGGVTHILSRVTGRQSGLSASMLYGAVETTTPVKFFFMNPAGIVFGPNAQLNVGSSVNFTTANYIRLFEETTQKSAMFYANPASDAVTTAGKASILTIAPPQDFGFMPAAFGFLDGNSAGITVLSGSTLSVAAGSDLTLVAGNKEFTYKDPDTEDPVTAAGGIRVRGGLLSAPAGQIKLASVASAGELLVANLQPGPNINGQSFSTMGTVALTEGAFLDVSDNAFEAGGAAGTIRIRGGQLVMDSAGLFAITQGDVNGATTAVEINVTADVPAGEFAVSLNNFSSILSQATGTGRGGDIIIVAGTDTQPGHVDVADSSNIATHANGDGRGGDIFITKADTLSVHGAVDINTPSAIESLTDGSSHVGRAGDGGNISIQAGTVNIGSVGPNEPGIVRTVTEFDGKAGNVDLHATDVNLRSGGALLTRSSREGTTGLLTVNATGTVSLAGDPQLLPAQQSKLENSHSGTGQGLGITVDAKNVQITDGAQVLNTGSSSIGPVNLTASDSILISGRSKISNESTSGLIGPIGLTAGKNITVSDRAEIQGSTQGSAPGSMIRFTGESISLSGQVFVTSRTNSTGQGGKILFNASDKITIADGSIVTTSSLDPATGSGGSIGITSGNQIALKDPGTKVLSQTDGAGNGGNITFTSGNMTTLSSGATVSANSTSTAPNAGNAGNITINAGGNFESNGGKVTTTAARGQGGDINITAGQDIRLTNTASVSASSTGAGNAGNITALAGDDFIMQNSSITTQATQASGGNIKIGAADQIVIRNSLISASVMGGTGSGGNIFIDPNAVILQNSRILAQAIQGNGGNISIITPFFLADQASVISASSQFGLNGTITIQSPTSNLSGSLGTLATKPRQAQSLLTQRCAALANGQASSFVVAGREQLPADPGGWLTSPLAFAGIDPEGFGEGAVSESTSHLAPRTSGLLANSTVSLRRLTPSGFLLANFADSEATGCHS
jgi:filamentous hemagglutinin family protein